MHDALGLPVSGANAAGLSALQAGLDDFRRYIGDPAANAAEAAQAAPGMPMAHLLTAWLHLLGTEPTALPAARASCAAAALLPLNDRERMHLQAAEALTRGQWRQAGRVLEDLGIAYPRDLLALQAGHQIDFFTGDARMLRDRIARALPHWQPGMPGFHAMLSMHAFGLEETGDYARAERCGRQAVELEPRDGWGWHAVAHVHEMRNDPAAGVEWLGAHSATWSDGSFFAVHNWWHLALFNLELGNEAEVLRLYDEAIGTGSSVLLDLVDASAMLWRLQLRGVPLGDRWSDVADRWLASGAPGHYAFNDLHMMMAFVGAGREDAQAQVLAAQQEALHAADDNARFTAEVGHPAAAALHAWGRGDYARCVALLRGIRSGAHRFGGSHAQRDVIDLTLLDAAERAGQRELAQALRCERGELRPRTASAPHLALAA
ncbi:tetratricopeptide repeat protein [Ramlibacter sp. AN1015]|uniref:tetratricopeptide repeat protein n=1 Tax=Ramlibacter sp. AN1015 TaxID=3133428 RepID=UPI0030BD06C7